MSHLNHIVALNTKLIENGITSDPSVQAKIAQNAVVRAVVAYSYMTCAVEGPGMSNEGAKAMEGTVEMWNEVSPLNCREIFSEVRAVFQLMYNQAVAGGEFTPIKFNVEGVEESVAQMEEFNQLFRTLLTEMVEYNR